MFQKFLRFRLPGGIDPLTKILRTLLLAIMFCSFRTLVCDFSGFSEIFLLMWFWRIRRCGSLHDGLHPHVCPACYTVIFTLKIVTYTSYFDKQINK